MSINKGTDKEDVVHVYKKYYSAIKKNDILKAQIQVWKKKILREDETWIWVSLDFWEKYQ